MPLSGKQRRALRALGHHLDPVVSVGKEGVTASVIGAVDQALADHELIKVKVGESSPIDRHEAAEELSAATDSEIAQVLGRTLLLFRRHPDEPKIALPDLPLPPKTEKPAAAAKSAPKVRREKAAAGKAPARKAKPSGGAKKPAGRKAGARGAPRR